jgi:hypothetical protein
VGTVTNNSEDGDNKKMRHQVGMTDEIQDGGDVSCIVSVGVLT